MLAEGLGILSPNICPSDDRRLRHDNSLGRAPADRRNLNDDSLVGLVAAVAARNDSLQGGYDCQGLAKIRNRGVDLFAKSGRGFELHRANGVLFPRLQVRNLSLGGRYF